jgi:hypothetical protein
MYIMPVTPINAADKVRYHTYRPENTLFSELVRSNMKKASVR